MLSGFVPQRFQTGRAGGGDESTELPAEAAKCAFFTACRCTKRLWSAMLVDWAFRPVEVTNSSRNFSPLPMPLGMYFHPEETVCGVCASAGRSGSAQSAPKISAAARRRRRGHGRASALKGCGAASRKFQVPERVHGSGGQPPARIRPAQRFHQRSPFRISIQDPTFTLAAGLHFHAEIPVERHDRTCLSRGVRGADSLSSDIIVPPFSCKDSRVSRNHAPKVSGCPGPSR